MEPTDLDYGGVRNGSYGTVDQFCMAQPDQGTSLLSLWNSKDWDLQASATSTSHVQSFITSASAKSFLLSFRQHPVLRSLPNGSHFLIQYCYT